MNKKLIHGGMALVVLLLIALLLIDREDMMYKKPVQEIFTEGQADSLYLRPDQLKKLISTGNLLLVDIRKPEFFITESIEGAINIPSGKLLTEEKEEQLEEAMESGKKIIVFADNSSESLLPWLLLRQKGFNNALLLLGGMEGWKKFEADPTYQPAPIDFQALDYSAEIEKLKNNVGLQPAEEKTKEKPKIVPKPVEHRGAAEGGC